MKADHPKRLNEILEKTRLLIEQLNSSKQQLQQLQHQLKEAHQQMTARDETIAQLREQNKIARIASQQSNAEDTAELKRKLNEYIREVDKCLALLGN
ncbi:MAG: hypothetical protein U0T84_01455 [Chitinophagales bacterium]